MDISSGFNELETAVRLKSHLIHMIRIDGGTYDMVGSWQRIKCHRVSGVDFGPVDPVMYAEAFGATGLRIDRPDQITATLRKAFDAPGPVLVDVHVDYRPNVNLYERSLREQHCSCGRDLGFRRLLSFKWRIGEIKWPA